MNNPKRETAAGTTPSQEGGAAAHYDTLLAEIYAWMVGDLEAATAAAQRELASLGVLDATSGQRALDLGAGLGLHAVALVRMGWDVTAIDTSAPLVAALVERAPTVRALTGDLVHAAAHVDGGFDLVICMGDTLAHLGSEDDVELALAGAASRLAPGGRLVLRFRDYVTRTRVGAERFVLVRADDARILTCCLDFEPRSVMVTDVVHERTEAGWSLRASTYRKLRLRREDVAASLRALGLETALPDVSGAWLDVVGTRPRRAP